MPIDTPTTNLDMSVLAQTVDPPAIVDPMSAGYSKLEQALNIIDVLRSGRRMSDDEFRRLRVYFKDRFIYKERLMVEFIED